MTRRRSASPRRAFVLMEVLAVLALLAAFAVVSAKLFTSMMRLTRDTTAAETASARFESALAALRTDVWTADQLQAQSTTLILTSANGSHVVTWLADANGNLSRTETGAAPVVSNTRSWNTLPARLSFSVEGTLISLQVQEKVGPPETLTLPSEAASLLHPPTPPGGTP